MTDLGDPDKLALENIPKEEGEEENCVFLWLIPKARWSLEGCAAIGNGQREKKKRII